MNPKLVHITFLDHYQDSTDKIGPGKCEVVGWLLKEDKQGYTVCCWKCDDSWISHNSDGYYIVKHPGIKVRYLR
jgi:hypothetical protein